MGRFIFFNIFQHCSLQRTISLSSLPGYDINSFRHFLDNSMQLECSNLVNSTNKSCFSDALLAAMGPPAPTTTPAHSFRSRGGRMRAYRARRISGRSGGPAEGVEPKLRCSWGSGVRGWLLPSPASTTQRVWAWRGSPWRSRADPSSAYGARAVPARELLRYRVKRGRPGHCGYQRSALNRAIGAARVVGAMPKSWHSDLRFFLREFTSFWDVQLKRKELYKTTTAELGQSSYGVSYKAGTVTVLANLSHERESLD